MPADKVTDNWVIGASQTGQFLRLLPKLPCGALHHRALSGGLRLVSVVAVVEPVCN